MNEITATLVARGLTIILGVIAGWLAQHVPGISQHTADEMTVGAVTGAVAWATKHFADASWFKSLFTQTGQAGVAVADALQSPEVKAAIHGAVKAALAEHAATLPPPAPPRPVS